MQLAARTVRRSILGSSAAVTPSSGRNAQSRYTNSMPCRSATAPSTAAPMPPMPKARPKNRPDTAPILPGMSSWANTRIAEKAEASMRPMMKLRMPVHHKSDVRQRHA